MMQWSIVPLLLALVYREIMVKRPPFSKRSKIKMASGWKVKKLPMGPAEPPPAKAFWSVANYTGPDFFLYDNPEQKYSISTYDKDLEFNDDGSIIIIFSHERPDGIGVTGCLPLRTFFDHYCLFIIRTSAKFVNFGRRALGKLLFDRQFRFVTV